VPWELRVLVVRLGCADGGDGGRRGVMAYFELARECREWVVKSGTNEEKDIWRARLRDCGVRVANTLVEMGDLTGAARHLSTLHTADDDRDNDIAVMETLTWLRVGDIASARRTLSSLTPTSTSTSSPSNPDPSPSLTISTLTALLALSTSAPTPNPFQSLHTSNPTNPMITTNLAVCLVYTGRIAEAQKIFSEVVDSSPPFHSAVFNLCTVFELCSERSGERKMGVVEGLAGRKGDGVGWEVGRGVFKL